MFTLIGFVLAPAEDKDAELLTNALLERLSGTPNGRAAERLRRRLDTLRAQTVGAPHWFTLAGNTARRRDHVEVMCNQVRADVGDPVVDPPFIVVFPGAPGIAGPAARLNAPTFALALAEVDERWPMASWWNDIDPPSAPPSPFRA